VSSRLSQVKTQRLCIRYAPAATLTSSRIRVHVAESESLDAPWIDQPRLHQSTQAICCWKLGHSSARYKCKSRRQLCSKPYPEPIRRQKYSKCKAENRPEDVDYTHPPRYVNCREDHEADSAVCPKHILF
jgi:hypothetical protein